MVVTAPENVMVSTPVPAPQFVHILASAFALVIASRRVQTPSPLFNVSPVDVTVNIAALAGVTGITATASIRIKNTDKILGKIRCFMFFPRLLYLILF